MSYKFLSIENKTTTLKSGANAGYAIVTLNIPPMNAATREKIRTTRLIDELLPVAGEAC